MTQPNSEQRSETLGTIRCLCGACSVTVADNQARCYVRCGCNDCRQFAQYTHLKGGVSPVSLPRLFYFKSDILAVEGKENIKGLKLRAGGASTRLCCKNCYSVLAVDHPSHWGNVFLMLPDYCSHDCDLTRPLSAYINMSEFYAEEDTKWEPYVPLFESFRFRRQRMQYNLLPDRIRWRDSFEPKGIRLGDLVKQLDRIEILNLNESKKSVPDLEEQIENLNRDLRSLKNQLILMREIVDASELRKSKAQSKLISLSEKLLHYEKRFGDIRNS